MLTLITGTPGAGKTLYAVSELARKVPGSTVESEGRAVPRRLLSNIKDLLVEHEHIDAAALNTWHEWAQPGDVILFDEVQEVWRPRALGKDTPPAIAALETHRHKGVDIILVTQHPMLLDSNIRRLVNQHLHVRRIAKGFSWIYEWDHCSNISTFKTALQSRVWRYPKDVFALYKSAQLHTKPVTRMPRLLLVGVLAVVALGVAGKVAYSRITERFGGPAATAQPLPDAPASGPSGESAPAKDAGVPAPAGAPMPDAPVVASTPVFLGCIASASACRCYEESGRLADVSPEQCRDGATSVLAVVQQWSGAGLASAIRPYGRGPVPSGSDNADHGSEAAAAGLSAEVYSAGDPIEVVHGARAL